MENMNVENQILEGNVMEFVDHIQPEPVPKKAVSILDTRMAIRHLKCVLMPGGFCSGLQQEENRW